MSSFGSFLLPLEPIAAAERAPGWSRDLAVSQVTFQSGDEMWTMADWCSEGADVTGFRQSNHRLGCRTCRH